MLFHLATPGLVVYAWSRRAGWGLAALAAMVFLHAALNYAVVPFGLGVFGLAVLEAWVAVVGLASFGALAVLARRAGASALQAKGG